MTRSGSSSAISNCTAGRRASPPQDCGDYWIYLSELDRHDARRWEVIERLAEALDPFVVTAELLKDALPVDEKLNDVTIRNHLFQAAERMEQALGDERPVYIEGCERDWEPLPIPDGPSTVGIDGGFVRARRKQRHFEVITGKSILAFKRDDPEDDKAPDANSSPTTASATARSRGSRRPS